MKRLRVIGFEEERDELLQKLLHLGCVEISEPEDKLTDPEWTALLRRDGSALTDRKAEAAALSSALDALSTAYAPSMSSSATFAIKAGISIFTGQPLTQGLFLQFRQRFASFTAIS